MGAPKISAVRTSAVLWPCSFMDSQKGQQEWAMHICQDRACSHPCCALPDAVKGRDGPLHASRVITHLSFCWGRLRGL